MKTIKWVDDAVLVVEVAEGVYTLAQMREHGLMEFFDTFRTVDEWEGIDLNNSPILFCLFIASKPVKKLFLRFLAADEVKVNERPILKKMLSFRWVSEDTYTADLIELSDRYSSIGARVLKSDLCPEKDLEIIESHDFCGVAGDPVKLQERLRFFYDTGINWDDSKQFIFPALKTPEALLLSRKKSAEALISAPDVKTGLQLLEGYEELLAKIYPVVSALYAEVLKLQGADAADRALPLFKNAVLHINQFEDEIETVERESLMEVLYQLGERVGLSRDTEFLEQWRGDW
ncbi:hypothetical protein KDX30_08490 [Pseudomonas sp. CDFA 553]|uniref:hypothetical protein n=1 Tax=Pseudomonas quasicaspiana TaxID=2829821 RepID=UPI001E4E1B3F|nr:hypothetical protein [Pseudomonas quasicaspiana]MCD5987938.1 hypothetical protein [Pseudomonas quasicaspiana]